MGGELLDVEPRDSALAAGVPPWTDVDSLAAWLELMLAISPVGQLDASTSLFPARALLNQWNADSYGHGVTASLLGWMHRGADVCWAIPHQTSSIIHRLKWKPVSNQKHFSPVHAPGGWGSGASSISSQRPDQAIGGECHFWTWPSEQWLCPVLLSRRHSIYPDGVWAIENTALSIALKHCLKGISVWAV